MSNEKQGAVQSLMRSVYGDVASQLASDEHDFSYFYHFLIFI